jgi:hypothetical protein
VTAFCSQVVSACSFDTVPLRKRFRAARNVVIAEVLEISDAPKNLTDAEKLNTFGSIKFKVLKSWKGTKQSQITLLSDIGCTPACDIFRYFEKGKKYLMFTDANYVSYCATDDAENNIVKKRQIKKLDDFWFRTWARIYPF